MHYIDEVCLTCCMQLASIDQTAIHFSLDSNLIVKDSDEALRYLSRQGGETSVEEDSEKKAEVEGEQEQEEGGQRQEPTKKKRMSVSATGEQQLRNQFNYSERASQTLNNPCRVCKISCVSNLL